AGLDDNTLKAACEQAIASNPNAVADYLSGKEKALKAILGGVMKATRGRADAVQAEQLLIELIKKR
ncbi:Asp-tRNA(Asn)/Glu-tRNA(Gln) amidotransferase GatCAB subunit B, partial [Clostridium sp. 2-1]